MLPGRRADASPPGGVVVLIRHAVVKVPPALRYRLSSDLSAIMRGSVI